MATSQNTLIGRASGSVDGVTFLTIFRKNVMRAKMIAQTNPNSTAQQSQRFKYNTLLNLYNSLREFVDIGFLVYSKNRTMWNTFMRYNMKTVFTNNGTPVPDVDFSKLLISRGTIGKQFITNIAAPSGTFPALQWNFIAYKPYNALSTDIPYAVLINSQTGQYWLGNPSQTRLSNFISFGSTIKPDTGYSYYAFLFFQNPITKQVSDSAFYEHKFV